MKSIKLMILLAVVAVVSCNKSDETDEPNTDVYYNYYALYLSFQDASGNDLVKGIFGTAEEPTNEQVLFTAVFPTHWQTRQNTNMWVYFIGSERFKERFPELKNNKYDHLLFTAHANRVYYDYGVVVKLPFAEVVTFKLKSPYIFGDGVEHEIVTYWEQATTKSEYGVINVTLCYRIEFSDKEITEITYVDNSYYSVATIVWEGN